MRGEDIRIEKWIENIADVEKVRERERVVQRNVQVIELERRRAV